MELKQQRVAVHEIEVDLLVLLLAHYSNIDCIEIQMKSLAGYTSITAERKFLDHKVVFAILPFLAITGCDVTRKCSENRKEFWTGRFLPEKNNFNFSPFNR